MTLKKVVKRDGTFVDYDRKKISNVIEKANMNVKRKFRASKEEINHIIEEIEATPRTRLCIEDIQDTIEKSLAENGKFELSKSYITYRHTREMVRRNNTTDESVMSILEDMNKDVAEENSNKDTMLASTQRDIIAGEISKDICKRILLPKDVVKGHEDGVIHFHDMDYFIQPIFNCCLADIKDMLDNGTVINGKMIESPKSFQVACTVITQGIANLTSNQMGGLSVNISHLGKYLRKNKEKIKEKLISNEKTSKLPQETIDELVDMRMKEELKSGIQTIQYQINTLFTTNGQSPFVTLFLYLDKDDEYLEETAMIIEEILKQRILGIKNENGVYITPAFPKLVYVLDEINNLSGGKYDYITKLAVECTSKRMYPDYISAKKMREIHEGNVFSPMGKNIAHVKSCELCA